MCVIGGFAFNSTSATTLVSNTQEYNLNFISNKGLILYS